MEDNGEKPQGMSSQSDEEDELLEQLSMNTNKIIWGSILAAGLALLMNYSVDYIENIFNKRQT